LQLLILVPSTKRRLEDVQAKTDIKKKKKEFATILAYDVRVMLGAAKFVEKEEIKIFTAKTIYHLFDEFTAYVKQC